MLIGNRSGRATKNRSLKKICQAVLSSALLMGLSPFVLAAEITDLQFASLPGDQVEITLSFDEPPPEPRGYTIEQPARIALDLFGTSSALSEKYYNLGVGNARAVTVMDVKDRTRVIINLTELSGYTTRREGNKLFVVVGKDQVAQALSQAEPGYKPKSTLSSSDVATLEDVDFQRGADGEGQVVITMSDPNATVDLREQSGQIVVEFVDVELPERLQRRLDVVDFATPVQLIDAISEEGDAVLMIKPKGDYEYLAYQADRQFTVSVKPVTEEELAERNKDKFLYTGEKLSLNFQDIEVRSVLQLIADFTGLNLVASDTVSGRITLRLQNVPWDQALDLILKTKGLDKRKVGNVMLVAPADEIAAREKLELESSKQVEELAPLRTEFIQVNYAKANELAELITGGEGTGLLSSRGSVTVDARTNTLLVNDTVGKIDEVRRMLNKLDVPVKQVLIEARVVVANSDFGKELGVKWGNSSYNINGDSIISAGGSSTTIIDQFESTQNVGGNIELPQLQVTTPDNLIVDLGVTEAGASSFSLGFFDLDSGLLELELSALENGGQADIIATPKVLTADQQAARISSGTEIPYQEASSSGATSVSFKEAVLSLNVTPQITPDGRIIMDLQVNQDTIGQIFNDVPSIDTNEITTRVFVDDGETVVLGGVFRTETIHATTKTPFFGDLPVIGRFFRNVSDSESKQELLVFITPKIVRDVLAQQ
jgi:type IV pilus assembly protein PilQ